jgi:hypothetical protein
MASFRPKEKRRSLLDAALEVCLVFLRDRQFRNLPYHDDGSGLRPCSASIVCSSPVAIIVRVASIDA